MGEKAKNSFMKNAIVVSAMTMISRIGGLVREILMADYFGTGVLKSAFDVAYRFPNLFRRLCGEGALSAALIPVYTEIREKEGEEAANRLAAAVSGVVTAGLVLLSMLVILVSYPIEHWCEGSKWAQIMPLLRIMMMYAPLICLAAQVMGVLNSLGSFAISSLAPAFQNLCCIAVLFCVCPFLAGEGSVRIEAVSWAVLFSGLLQVVVQLPELRKYHVPLRLIFRPLSTAAFRRVFLLTAPMAFAAGIFQINVLLDGILAMKAAAWGPSVLGYADRLVYLPLAIVGTSFSTVLLPQLSGRIAVGDTEGFTRDFERALSNVIAIMVPASVGMIALARPIISVVYESGKFDATSTERTSYALIAYAAGLLAAGLHKVIVQAFYSRQNTRTPFVVGTVSVGLNLCLNLFFIWILPVESKPMGIAIATSISSFVSCLVLLWILQKQRVAQEMLFRFRSLSKVTLGALVSGGGMVLVVFWGIRWFPQILWEGFPKRIADLILLGVIIPIGAVVYFVIFRILCPEDWRSLRIRRCRVGTSERSE